MVAGVGLTNETIGNAMDEITDAGRQAFGNPIMVKGFFKG